MLELVPPGRVIFLRPLKAGGARAGFDAVWVRPEEIIREVRCLVWATASQKLHAYLPGERLRATPASPVIIWFLFWHTAWLSATGAVLSLAVLLLPHEKGEGSLL